MNETQSSTPISSFQRDLCTAIMQNESAYLADGQSPDLSPFARIGQKPYDQASGAVQQLEEQGFLQSRSAETSSNWVTENGENIQGPASPGTQDGLVSGPGYYKMLSRYTLTEKGLHVAREMP